MKRTLEEADSYRREAPEENITEDKMTEGIYSLDENTIEESGVGGSVADESTVNESVIDKRAVNGSATDKEAADGKTADTDGVQMTGDP